MRSEIPAVSSISFVAVASLSRSDPFGFLKYIKVFEIGRSMENADQSAVENVLSPDQEHIKNFRLRSVMLFDVFFMFQVPQMDIRKIAIDFI